MIVWKRGGAGEVHFRPLKRQQGSGKKSWRGEFSTACLNPPNPLHTPCLSLCSSGVQVPNPRPPLPPTTLARAHLDDRPAAANFFTVEGNVLLRTFRLRPLIDLDLHLTEPGLVVHVGEGLWGRRVGRGRQARSKAGVALAEKF